jgi:hypothetical protein
MRVPAKSYEQAPLAAAPPHPTSSFSGRVPLPSKNGKKKSDEATTEPQELSFMKPIEAGEPGNDEPKLSRAERRAQKPQAKTFGKVQNLRNQAVPGHRNFTQRRSGG